MARSGLSMLAVLVLSLAAACGSDSSDADSTRSDAGASGTPTPKTTTRPPLSSVPPPMMTSPQAANQPVRPDQPVTVSGTVSRSGDCVDLVTSTARWTLIGAAAADLDEGAGESRSTARRCPSCRAPAATTRSTSARSGRGSARTRFTDCRPRSGFLVYETRRERPCRLEPVARPSWPSQLSSREVWISSR